MVILVASHIIKYVHTLIEERKFVVEFWFCDELYARSDAINVCHELLHIILVYFHKCIIHIYILATWMVGVVQMIVLYPRSLL